MSRYSPTAWCALLAVVPMLSCTSAGGSERAWTGRMDTLATGTVAVLNPATPVWDEAGAWRVREDLRIGRLEGGSDRFGRITSLTVDGAGRMYVLEGQARVRRDDG